MFNLLHSSQNALRQIGILALLAGLVFAPFSVRPALAHNLTPPRILQDCAHFFHGFGPVDVARSYFDLRTGSAYQFRQSVSPDGTYGGLTDCGHGAGPKMRLWNIWIDLPQGVGRRVIIRPTWGLGAPQTASACRESNIVYKVWVMFRYSSDHIPLRDGDSVLYGVWTAGNESNPGWCAWRSDNPRTPQVETDPTQVTVDAESYSSMTHILVSAQAVQHVRVTEDRWIFGTRSVKVLVSVRPFP
ncbi:MAG: hypothetical protein ACT4QE_14775 [Anaerolineales bacterium]